MKKIISKLPLYLTAIVFITCLEVGLLAGVALIPQKSIQRNIEESTDILLDNPVFFYENKQDISSKIDRYADSILLNIAYYYDEANPLSSVLRSSYYYTDKNNENKNLQIAVTTQPEATYDYNRYWHGSNIIVRPLLTIFNLNGIYIFLGALLLLLFLGTVYFAKKHLGNGVSVCFILATIMISPWYIPLSLEYIWTILLMLLGCLFLFRLWEKDDFVLHLFFLIMGSLTAYFDFLTTETLTLMIPLILYLCRLAEKKQITSVKVAMKYSLPIASFWIIGYLSSFIMKWSISSVVLRENTFYTALSQAQYRLQGSTDKISGVTGSFAAILLNLKCLFPFCFLKNGALPLCILFFILMLSLFYITKKKAKMPVCTYLLLLGIVPYIRFFVIGNHSYIHYFFTYRAQLSTVFVLFLSIYYGTDWTYLSKKLYTFKPKKKHKKNGNRK